MNLKKIIIFLILTLTPMLFGIGVLASEVPMRGVWVSTVYGLDFPSSATTDSRKLKTEIDTIVANCKETGYNTIFFQVRPSADSFYPSYVFPWSKYLTGQNGLAPADGFDPLAYFIEVCHENSIELHAWINPYRVTKGSDAELNSLSASHPAKLNPQWLVKYTDGNYYFNPGIPEVQDLVYGGVAEILQNYNVDGIHLDDYFYPGVDFDDAEAYQKYNNGNFSNIADWRRNNVDEMVRGLHKLAGLYGKEFGVSPSGIWDNYKDNPLGSNTNGRSSYSQLYADTRGWVKKGYVDYIAPQVYWEFGHKLADFETVTLWWADVCSDTDVKLYIGLASYNGAGAKESSVWYGGKETLKQMEFVSKDTRIDGEIHFRYKLIWEDEKIKNTIKNYYAKDEFSDNASDYIPPKQNETQDEIKVYVNGRKIEFDTLPMVENERIMVPMRAVFEALDAVVRWDGATNTAIAEKDGDIMKVQIGSYVLKLNDERHLVDTPAKILNNRTLMPLRAISEAFKYDVKWDGVTKTVSING